MNEEQVLIARLQDLAKRAYRQNIYTYTGFLTPAELAVVYEKQADFSFVGMTCFGGTPECERQMVQFGSEELFGYAGVFPISIILVEPLLDKFAEDLSHRDFLGALMNLVATLGYILPAAIVYQKMHTYKGAVIGLVLGVIAATALSMVANLTIGVWFWYGSVDVIAPLMIPAVLPFNLIKTVLNSVLTLAVYKAVSNLITPKKDQVKGRA